MSVVENLASMAIMVTIVVSAYLIINMQQVQEFENQYDIAEVTFYEHKVSEDLSGILETKEPTTGLPLIELIGYMMYYKKQVIETEYTQVEIKGTVKNVFDSVYGEKNYYLEVEPRAIDLRMVFIIDGSLSLRDDLETLSETLPRLAESFEGTGLTVSPEVFIILSDDEEDKEKLDCDEFSWEATISGEDITIPCFDRDQITDVRAIAMEEVYGHPFFDDMGDLAVDSYEDWATATAWKAVQLNESPLVATTLIFPITDELSTGSEQNQCNEPDYSFCERMYSAECCDDIRHINGVPRCYDSKCYDFYNDPEICGHRDLDNYEKTSVFSCWVCNELGISSDGSYQFCNWCKRYQSFCSVCGITPRAFSDKGETDYLCQSDRSAQTVENAMDILEKINRPDFYVFPIITKPCYPSQSDPLIACNTSTFGYECWNYNICKRDSSGLHVCCEQGNTYCPACSSNAGVEACIRETCDEAFSIAGFAPFTAGDGESDLVQQMTLLAKASANTDGTIFDLTEIFDVDVFKDELRALVIDITDVDFRIGSFKPREERYVSSTTIPLSNGGLTKAKLWLYKDREPHIIERAEAVIEKLNYAPEAILKVFPMPYCPEDPDCDVTFDAQDSTDPNFADPTFGETIYYSWSITTSDVPGTNFADEPFALMNADNTINDYQDIPLPTNAASERLYDIRLTVTDEDGATDSASLQDYCVGENCSPDLLYIFMPVKWNSTYDEYKTYAEEECAQLIASLEPTCDPSKIRCEIIPDADLDGKPDFSCDEDIIPPLGMTDCVCQSAIITLPDGTEICRDAGDNWRQVLSGLVTCAQNAGLDDPALDWSNEKRVIGLMPNGMPFCGGGGVVGYTTRYGKSMIDRTGYKYVGVHELGHTYGLCDEYDQGYWDRQNRSGTCPNAWPGCTPGCGRWCCGDSCLIQPAGNWTCLSVMGPAMSLPSVIQDVGRIDRRDYDSKSGGTVIPPALGDSDKAHIQMFLGCG